MIRNIIFDMGGVLIDWAPLYLIEGAGVSKEDADMVIRESMDLIRQIVEKHEGVIGHIKSAISQGEHSAVYSLTYDEIFRVGEYDSIDSVEGISFAAIVYGLDELILESLLVVTKERLM